jgi:hypothetical protein
MQNKGTCDLSGLRRVHFCHGGLLTFFKAIFGELQSESRTPPIYLMQMFCFVFWYCGTVSILSKGVAKLEMHWFAVVMSYGNFKWYRHYRVMELLRGGH